jgi:glutaredoxin
MRPLACKEGITNMKIRVFSTANCPKCIALKAMLSAMKKEFENVDMTTPEALTELRVNGVFTLTAPVLQAGDRFFTVEELFDEDRLKSIERIVSP